MKAKRALCMLAAILLVVAMMLMFLTGCNRQVIDTTFSYDNAILALPDGSVISGKIESWKDYDDGDQIQVKIDGTTYLVHSANIALIKEYTDVIRIRATKIGSFRKKYACTQKKKPEAAMRPRLSASEQLGYFAKKYV